MHTVSTRSSSFVTLVFLYTPFEYSFNRAFISFARSFSASSVKFLSWWSLGSATLSYVNWRFVALYSDWPAGLKSPRHVHFIGRLQLMSALLKTHAAQSCCDTMALGCKRLVRMMLGYMAATSKW